MRTSEIENEREERHDVGVGRCWRKRARIGRHDEEKRERKIDGETRTSPG